MYRWSTRARSRFCSIAEKDFRDTWHPRDGEPIKRVGTRYHSRVGARYHSLACWSRVRELSQSKRDALPGFTGKSRSSKRRKIAFNRCDQVVKLGNRNPTFRFILTFLKVPVKEFPICFPSGILSMPRERMSCANGVGHWQDAK